MHFIVYRSIVARICFTSAIRYRPSHFFITHISYSKWFIYTKTSDLAVRFKSIVARKQSKNNFLKSFSLHVERRWLRAYSYILLASSHVSGPN